MGAVKRILFPVDLSEVSPKIAPWVRSLADDLKAELYILFVARAFEHYAGMGVPLPYISDFEEHVRHTGETRLAEFVESHFGGRTVTTKVLAGHPADKILEYARDSRVDLIVIGSHGRRGLEKIVFGSIAEHVVKHSPIPVLTINPYRGA